MRWQIFAANLSGLAASRVSVWAGVVEAETREQAFRIAGDQMRFEGVMGRAVYSMTATPIGPAETAEQGAPDGKQD